jgi:hypothetical protein
MQFVRTSLCDVSLGFLEDDIYSDCSLGNPEPVSASIYNWPLGSPEDDIDLDCSLGNPEPFNAPIYNRSFGSPEDDIDSDCSRAKDCIPVLSVTEWEQLYQCPLLCRIVQAYILERHWDWVDFHILLDVSWDELRAAICTLRPFTGADKGKIVALLKCMARHLLSDASSRAISLELARGSIRFLNDIRTGQQPSRLWCEVFTQIQVRSLTSY